MCKKIGFIVSAWILSCVVAMIGASGALAADGAELLVKLGSAATAANDGSAQTQYVSPGDVFRISLPGEDALNRDFMVDRRERLMLPEVGSVDVKGLTPEQLSQKLSKLFAVVYRDSSRLTVQLKERRLLVNVLGYVKQPGPVDLPSEGSMQMAINAAQGLLAGAQLDRIQLRRGVDTSVFDYKYYLDSGDASKIPELRSSDVVFVPSSPLTGNVQMDFDATRMNAIGESGEDRTAIKVFGEVNKPGIYSFREGATLIDILMRAGGVSRFAGVDRIRIISSKNEPAAFNMKVFLDTGESSKMPQIKPGSTIFVPKEDTEIKSGENTIYVMGEVFKPGAYESKPGASFLDILANAGGPTRFAESSRIRVLSANGEIKSFDLRAYSDGSQKNSIPQIRPGDAVFVPEKVDANEKSWISVPPGRAVGVIGAVTQPGRFEWSSEMSFMDLLSHAGGPTASADLHNIRITTRVRDRVTSVDFNLSLYLETGDVSLLPKVVPGDTVYVPDRNRLWLDEQKEKTVRVLGAVNKPGRYRFDDSMTLLDLLAEAGGPKSDAYVGKITVVNTSCCKDRATTFDLESFSRSGDYSSIPLVRAGDTVFVPTTEQSNWKTFMSSVRDIVSVVTLVALLGLI